MDSTGIMEQIREHIAQGKKSGELIRMGYAPGTVYKVQRQMRRRASRAVLSQGKNGLYVDVSAAGKMQLCEEENKKLYEKVTQLENVKEGLEEEIINLKFERTNLLIQISQQMRRADNLAELLRQTRAEKTDLRKYLFYRNCDWQEDFALYLKRAAQPHMSKCTRKVLISLPKPSIPLPDR